MNDNEKLQALFQDYKIYCAILQLEALPNHTKSIRTLRFEIMKAAEENELQYQQAMQASWEY
tara:strand:+ start:64 stop:249 length:186 start_codon:yes stop_codon:yes gene_type:complete